VPRRAAIYTRISLDQTGEGAGVERQAEDCRKLIEQREWSAVAAHSDNSISAAGKRRRPGFDALLGQVERGELDVIVAWAWDRLSRNRRDEVRLIEACKEHAVSVTLVRGAGDLDMSSAVGRGIAEIMATLGRLENEQKSERQRRALEQLAEQGRPWGSRRPFGYQVGGMELEPVEAELLRRAYADLLGGASVRGIAARWNDAGVLTSRGGRWHGATVHQLLRNARYAGIRTYGRDEKRREVGPAAWPAVVDETTFRAAVSLLTDPARRVGVGRERTRLGTGLFLCGVCGQPVGSHIATSTGRWGYRCKPRGGRSGGHVTRAGDPVDALVSGVVVRVLSSPDAAALLVDRDAPDAAELNGEAVALRARLDGLAVSWADGALTDSQLRTMTERLRQRLGEVEARMTASTRAPVLAGLAGAADVAARWAALPLDRRRAAVDVLMTVTILPAGRGRGFDPRSVRVDPKG
jgi:site-specific DNA recombinase